MLSEFDNLKIHIDGAAAESGVSRFGEIYRSDQNNHHHHKNWTYSKNESLIDASDYLSYDVLLSGKHIDYFHPINQPEDHGVCGAFNEIYSAPSIFKMKLSYKHFFPYHYHNHFHHHDDHFLFLLYIEND